MAGTRSPCGNAAALLLALALATLPRSRGGTDRRRQEGVSAAAGRWYLLADHADPAGDVSSWTSSRRAELTPQKPLGDASCPCLTEEALAETSLGFASGAEDMGPDVDLRTYGAGCHAHDVNSTRCSPLDPCATAAPVPPDCERSWCARFWCYVDPNDCRVAHRPSAMFRRRFYSYATCGFMDSFTYAERLKSLRRRTFRVGLNSNSGGWKGAYHPNGSFAVDTDGWEGPMVNFLQTAASEGGFELNVIRPPEWLRVESQKFFGGSSFDYCVYATSLGYLDLCVSSYTISDKRASVVTFFETYDDPIYLVTFRDDGGTSLETFAKSFLMVFKPFTLGAWLMIMCFCLPVLGLLMLLHEYGAPGSAYPRKIPAFVINNVSGRKELTARNVPMWRHVLESLYMGFLAFFNESYDQSVVTPGGRINLLATSSFIMLVLAVYTANLAAILTGEVADPGVITIDDALRAGYNFCSERKVAEIVMDLYEVSPKQIVEDPISIGGDGLPGFNCPECVARLRVFDFMRQTHDDGSLYCNAAFASPEDLQILHRDGWHCDKATVGEALASQNVGIPVSDGNAEALLALFHQIKNDGVIERELGSARPESQCPVSEEEGNSLSIQQLTGVWMIAFFFAAAGLLAKVIHSSVKKKKVKNSSGTRVRALQRYDQWGNPTGHDIVINGDKFDPGITLRELHRSKASRRLICSSRRLVCSPSDSESKDESVMSHDLSLTVGGVPWNGSVTSNTHQD